MPYNFDVLNEKCWVHCNGRKIRPCGSQDQGSIQVPVWRYRPDPFFFPALPIPSISSLQNHEFHRKGKKLFLFGANWRVLYFVEIKYSGNWIWNTGKQSYGLINCWSWRTSPAARFDFPWWNHTFWSRTYTRTSSTCQRSRLVYPQHHTATA